MTHKLLLADDSVTIQRVVELTFSGEDVQVVTVGDGEQAIARIPIELPDVVLADIGMPKRSGYDVAAFVKGRPDLSHIPVLLLAGAFEPVDESRAQQVHSDGVLVKPFEPQQVIARVRDLIKSSRGPAARPLVAVLPEPSVAEHRKRAFEPLAGIVPPAVAASDPGAGMIESRERHEEPKLDDYFERLDAAFAQLGSDAERDSGLQAFPSDEFDGHEVPTLESLLAVSGAILPSSNGSIDVEPVRTAPVPVELADYEPALAHASSSEAGPSRSSQPAGRGNLVADMFAALFAVEQGESVAAAAYLPPAPSSAPAVSDALVDEVTRRVVARLAPAAAHDVVAQIVSDVAERLIREEIDRIKAAAARL